MSGSDSVNNRKKKDTGDSVYTVFVCQFFVRGMGKMRKKDI